MHIRDGLIPKVAELIYYGFWYSPEMKAIMALTDEIQSVVNGTARIKLYKGNCSVVGTKIGQFALHERLCDIRHGYRV